MSKFNESKDLDLIFQAIGNKHRREIIYSLGLQPHSISKLASLRGLSLPAIHKHIKILSDADLILTKKIGRINFLALNKKTVLKLQEWLMQYHAYWGNNNDSFENYTEYLSKESNTKGGESK